MRPSKRKIALNRLKAFKRARKEGLAAQQYICTQIVLDIAPSSYDGQMVKATRDILQVSQRLFAQFLGVSTAAVSAWEQETNIPNGMACRFMDEIRLAPDYWVQRLRNCLRTEEIKAVSPA
jgi:DNA-binding transcriptional regulator YiaG